jgi:SAM-dependent methyltransferase
VTRQEISPRHVSELADLGLEYWWFAVRLAHVMHALRCFTSFQGAAYLDFGCGTGTTTQAVLEELRPARVLGIDGTEAALDVAASRGLPVSYADFRKPLALPFRPNLITALDVLEHIDDDALALRSLAKAASDDAILTLTVPALPSLFSRWDEVSGHRRRYLRQPLGACLEANGWFPLRIRYFFSYCVPPAWIERRLLGRVQEFEFPRIRPALNALLTRLGELECRLGDPVPFGTSLIAVARRNRATT